MIASAAVNLFVERARAAKPDFALRPVDVPAVGEVCRRLDGVPLAIELAAARVVAMAPGEIAGLLDERFRLLTGGRRTAVERHQTLRATVDWSYSLLDDRDRSVFDRLGVFSGTFSADAAAAVVSGDGIGRFDVLDALTDLVTKSSVVADATDDGTTRYALLETLRQYARERLDEAGTGDDWRRSHAQHYAEFSEAIAPVLFTDDEIAARRRLHAELDNLRVAVGWAFDRDDRDDVEIGLRIPAALYNEAVLERASGIHAWALRALPHVDSTTPERRFAVRCCVAWGYHATGDLERCGELSRTVIDEGIPDDVDDCVSPYNSLGGSHAMQGDLARGMQAVDAGLALAEERGAPDWVPALSLAVGAMHLLGNNDYDQGRRYAERAIVLARRSRNPSTLTMATYALGWSQCIDDADTAIATLTDTIELCHARTIDAVHAPAMCQRGVLHVTTGRLEDAVRDIRAGFERSVEIRDELTIGAATLSSVAALQRLGSAEAAATILGALDAGVVFNCSGSGYGLFHIDEVRGAVAASLPDDEFAPAHQRGAALTYDEAVVFVRESLAVLAEAVETPG